jgi:hypothetical protein
MTGIAIVTVETLRRFRKAAFLTQREVADASRDVAVQDRLQNTAATEVIGNSPGVRNRGRQPGPDPHAITENREREGERGKERWRTGNKLGNDKEDGQAEDEGPNRENDGVREDSFTTHACDQSAQKIVEQPVRKVEATVHIVKLTKAE